MDTCRDSIYRRQWRRALKAASGVVQVQYVLGHMLEAKGWAKPDGFGSGFQADGDGYGAGEGTSPRRACGNGAGDVDGNCRSYAGLDGILRLPGNFSGNSFGDEEGNLEPRIGFGVIEDLGVGAYNPRGLERLTVTR